MKFQDAKINLGIPGLLSEWKKLFTNEYLFDDISAGLTVAFIAIPLSLAIALASGVSPEVGLVTAIIGGIVCALFGGTPLSVSGPAAAMCILIADLVEKFGYQSLILICALAGIMQLVSGVLGIGRLSRYVPIPVIAGFTAGIGVIILIGQLPRAFGLEPPPESHIISVLSHLKLYLHEINGTCIFLVALTIGIMRGLPKLLPKVPGILVAVVTASVITYIFDLTDVPLIGEIPRTLPLPQLPEMTSITLQALFLNAFFVYALASLETLLSCSAVDKLSKGDKHDSNQELIGQGLGNIVSSLFGGIPITSVIARSATNVRAGAKTRRASIIHSVVIILTIAVAAPLIGKIPVAALAGVLFSVAISMINVKEFYSLWVNARDEALIYVVTFLIIIFVDLLAGVQAGIVAACIIILIRSTKTHFHVTVSAQDDIVRLSLIGALTFLSTPKIADLQRQINSVNKNKIILMDLSNIRNLDMSGAAAIIEFYQYCDSQQIKFYLKGLASRFETIFKLSGGGYLLDELYLVSEHELRNKDGAISPKSAYGRLVHGFHRFYIQRHHDDKRLFKSISITQDPHTLFIACSDSRIIPSEMTSSDPGELFIVRNIGNFIPPYSPAELHSEAAAIQFALSSFDITDIMVCGHAHCGAMQACQQPVENLPSQELAEWIGKIKSLLPDAAAFDVENLAKMNVINQLNNLKKYPIVQQKLANKTLSLHGWYYDVENSNILAWDENKGQFKSIAPQIKREEKWDNSMGGLTPADVSVS